MRLQANNNQQQLATRSISCWRAPTRQVMLCKPQHIVTYDC
jgi:hypothetical protein